MALVDLKSDLSWYSSKGIPRGYRPNADKQSTDFVYNDDLTVSARPKGYANNGIAEMYPTITTANEFQIDNNTTSFRGTARRMNQLGEGTKFPIGPQGQVHKFDLPRLGFNPVTKYEETYGPLTNSGLADTYTLESPIDDMYNKFKVRDEAFNRGIIREPFILRGIQRDDNSDPQRFIGSDSPADIPRGGILTAIQRAAIDTARMSKFLLTSKGLNFMAKQATLALMNPNREGVKGTFQQPSINANSSKVVLPGNLVAQISTGFTGVHIRKHGQLPIDTPGFLPLPPSPPSNYEDIIKERNTGQIQGGGTVDPTDNNRLVLVYRELLRDKDGFKEKIGLGQEIPALSAVTGPTSISFDGGVQISKISRWSITKPFDTSFIASGDQKGNAGSIKFSDYLDKFTPFDFNNTYLDKYKVTDDAEPAQIDDKESGDSRLVTLLNSDRYNNNEIIITKNKFGQTFLNGFTGTTSEITSVFQLASAAGKTQRTRNLNYDDIPDSNRGSILIQDYRAVFNTKGEVRPAYDSYVKDDDTGHSNRQNRTEYMLIQLREEAKEGDRFDGVGDSNRALAERLHVDIPLKNPVTGNILNFKGTENEYGDIGAAASETIIGTRTTITDFRYDPAEKKKYQPYKIEESKDEIGIARQTDEGNTDGVNNLNKALTQRNPAKKATDDNAATIAKYKTLAYDDIQSAAEIMTKKETKILYNRPSSFDSTKKHGLYFAEALKAIDRKSQEYNDAVEGENGLDLITFSFNGIRFRAYIDQISDSFSPGFSPEPDQNRADPRYLYTTFERKIQISFKVVYEKTTEDPWGKLKALADLSLPEYGGGPWAQRVDVTIGALYKSVPMLIESISYDWDNETPWSMEGDQANTHKGLPMYTQVQMGLIYMGEVKAAANSGYVAYG